MPSITIYTTLPNVGGNSSITISLCKFFIKKIYVVNVIVRGQSGNNIDYKIVKNLREIGCNITIIDEHTSNIIVIFLNLLMAIWKLKSDVFISIGMGYMAPVISILGNFKKRCFYYINHDPNIKLLKRLGHTIRAFNTIIVISPASIEAVKKLKIKGQNIVWLPQFSELKIDFFETCNKNYTNELHFGFVGNLKEVKGILDLLKIWNLLKIPSRLSILGDGELKNTVIDICKNNSKIRYAGSFSAADRDDILPSFFSSIDYLLVPSKGHGEGIPTVILEALSCGVPVISTNGGGTIAFSQLPLKEDFSDTVLLVDESNFSKALVNISKPTHEIKTQAVKSYKKWFSDVAIEKKWIETVN